MSDAREPEEPPPSAAKSSWVGAEWSRLLDRLKFLKRHIVAIAAVGAVLSGLVGYWTTYRTVHEVIAPAVVGNGRPDAKSPPAMSLVVIPLSAPQGDAETARFADALTRDLVSRLGGVNGGAGPLRVIAFQGARAGEVTDSPELGRRLNARYVLEGNVLRTGEGNAVNLQLLDTATGGQVWSERSTLQDTALLGESAVKLRSLAQQLRTAIVVAEGRRVVALPVAGLSAPELVLRAGASLAPNTSSLAARNEARALTDKALQLDPNSVPALLGRVVLDDFEVSVDPNADRGRLTREMYEDSARAVGLDPNNARAWDRRAHALLYLGQWDQALEANATAIKLDPDESEYLSNRANIMNNMGRPAEALAFIDRALNTEATPFSNSTAAWTVCESYLLLGQADKAVSSCEKVAAGYRDNLLQAQLVAAYADQGDMTKAAAAKTELLRMAPGFTVAQARAADQPQHPEYAKLAEKYFYEGLRKAEIPEQ